MLHRRLISTSLLRRLLPDKGDWIDAAAAAAAAKMWRYLFMCLLEAANQMCRHVNGDFSGDEDRRPGHFLSTASASLSRGASR